jgi:chitin-binding protein
MANKQENEGDLVFDGGTFGDESITSTTQSSTATAEDIENMRATYARMASSMASEASTGTGIATSTPPLNMPTTSPQAMPGTYIDSIGPLKTFSVLTIAEDGSRSRVALCPGDFEKAEQLLSAEQYAQVQAMWTDDVVTAYTEAMAQNEANQPTIPVSTTPTLVARVAATQKVALKSLGVDVELTPDDVAALADGNVTAATDGAAWAANLWYAVDTTCTYNGATYKCIKAHMSMAAWTPDSMTELWSTVTSEIPEWVQPTSAETAYNTGDKVTYDGATWESTIDGNMDEPSPQAASWNDITVVAE